MDRLWIWFADNGNIRKWRREPFEEGTEYVAALSAPTPAGVVELEWRGTEGVWAKADALFGATSRPHHREVRDG